jgi:Ca-activated chloride channel family protein
MTPARSISFALLLAAAACGATHTKRDVAKRDALSIKPRAAITMTAEPTATLIAAGAASRLAVRIRITAPELAAADRPPLNLALVLDTSASMKGDAIDQVKRAAREIVEHLAPHDRLALITFSSRAKVVVDSVVMGESAARAGALAAIDDIVADGTTDLAGGLGTALGQVTTHRTPGGLDRVVLLADGFPNDPQPIPGLVQSASANRIAITTLGIGIEHSQEMLAAIARDTGGVYRYAPDGKEIAAVFQKELLRMQTLVAHDLSLRIGFGPGVELGAAPWLAAAGGRETRVALGDLAAGETRDVIVPVDVPGHRAGLTVEILDADLGYTDASAGTAETRTAFVGVEASDDAAAIAKSTKADLAIGQARAEAAGAIIQAINMARAGAIDPAKQLLAEAERVARVKAAELGDAELTELAERMTELGRNLVHVRPVTVIGAGDASAADDLTRPPASAPAAVEPAIRETYQKAKATIDPR